MKKNKKNINPIWGTNFKKQSNPLLEKINSSIDFDKRLALQDLRVSEVHSLMLKKQKIISSGECKLIIKGLKKIRTLIQNNKFVFNKKFEDIHMNIEIYLHNLIGDVAGKLQTARSRNDQVVTDFKLWIMEAIKKICSKLDDLQKIANFSNAILMQDDAHGFGVFESNIPKNSIYMATLGKAAGTMGAFVAGKADFIEFLIQKSRPYIYTTAISPAICVATLKSLELIKQGEQKAKLLAHIDFFRNFSQAIGLPISASKSAIQPLIIGDSEKALKISQKLFEQGFYVSAIRPPTVPKGTERLRITLNANHTQSQIEQLLVHIKNAL